MPYREIQISNANIRIIGGKAEDVDYQYKDVLDDFMNANVIRIATYNCNLPLSDDELIQLRQAINSGRVDAKIVIGVPGITSNDADRRVWEKRLEETIEHVRSSFCTEQIRINVFNHSKIVGTESKLYIGSQNFSIGSYLNYESGIIIEESDIIRRVYDDIYDNIWNEGISLGHAWDSFSNIRDDAFKITANEVYEYYIHNV